MKKNAKGANMDVLLALRSVLQHVRRDLGDAFSFSLDTPTVDVSKDVEAAEKAVEAALCALEAHWPTVDPSGRCSGCSKCRP